MKSLHEASRSVLLGKSQVTHITEAEDEAPESLEPTEAPEGSGEDEGGDEDKGKKDKGDKKPEFAAVCSKDGEDTVSLLSKDELEDLIHSEGAKCIVKLYELGKEAKVPTVKV